MARRLVSRSTVMGQMEFQGLWKSRNSRPILCGGGFLAIKQ